VTALLLSAALSVAQATEKLFSLVRPSQNSNIYVYHSPNLQVTFISSIDGLNIFDGIHVRTYRQSTHHMYGYNIQSNFFEDRSGLIWFSTYEALHAYNPLTDNFEYYFMISSCGDTLKENYKVFWKEKDILYLKAGMEFFTFDINTKKITNTYGLNLSKYFQLSSVTVGGNIDFICGDEGGFKHVRLYPDDAFNILQEGAQSFTSVLVRNQASVWVGHHNGTISVYDFRNKTFSKEIKISNGPVNGIVRMAADQLCLLASSGKLFDFDERTEMPADSFIVKVAETRESIRYLAGIYLDQDSTLWIGADGIGLLYKNLRKQKFQHWLSPKENEGPISVTKILPLENGHFLILTRKFGVLELDQNGKVIKNWKHLPTGEINFTVLTGALLDESNLLFVRNGSLAKQEVIFFVLDINTNQMVEMSAEKNYNLSWVGQIDKLLDGNILISAGVDLLYLFHRKGNTYELAPYGNCKTLTNEITNFKESPDSTLFVSDDEISILVFDYHQSSGCHQYAYRLPISGGIRGLCRGKNSKEVYFSNSIGLFRVDLHTRKSEQVIDHQNALLQTIYSILPDQYDNLWLGTNHGIIKYYTFNGAIKKYTLMDGIQALEYNSNASAMTRDGHMLFGGVNGLNYFHPQEVFPNTRSAQVYIPEVLINDEMDTTIRFSQKTDYIELPFRKNTITFEFHAIDYSDPDETRVRYQLRGLDKKELESNSADSRVRYPNLSPGEYTLTMRGRNSDGALSSHPKKIEIRIIPPLWRRWWFITLSGMVVLWLIYASIKSYYKRKLDKQNQLLREQSLIIEKQQAVEHERTRIASEMHDDLGSGLTTIRYLSDKALKQAKNQTEIEQIKHISEQSNTLVRNMSEIIWAMNSRFDNTENLVGYLRRYASEFLENHQVPLHFAYPDDDTPVVNIGGEKRRNVFLVFKELLNNAVKYSQAESIQIRVFIDSQLNIHISEVGGKGFDPMIAQEGGNGLYNCRKRIQSIHGRLEFEKLPDSMDIHIAVPLVN